MEDRFEEISEKRGGRKEGRGKKGREGGRERKGSRIIYVIWRRGDEMSNSIKFQNDEKRRKNGNFKKK